MSPPDSLEAAPWSELAVRWQALAQEWAQWWQRAAVTVATPATIPASSDTPNANAGPFFDARAVAELNERFAPRVQALWSRVLGESSTRSTAVDATGKSDRRFAAPAWRDQPYFAFIKDAYLLCAEYLTELASLAQLPPSDKQRFEFATRQYLDAIAPSNYPATNPEVLRRALETDGASLLQGFANLIADAQKGRITMSDERAFAVGRNLALTPGSVVFRNDLIEVIQYDATTPTVYERPLVIVPPCINKFYILDMRPENSFVRHAVAQGHTVFMISWRNIPQQLGRIAWDDYLNDGVLKAFAVAREIASTRTLNTLGF
ncbi:MAG TPA: class I poly(R)-hydroxyalkanoic acid synthase, partial [Casimicrobiaceae bacterium]